MKAKTPLLLVLCCLFGVAQAKQYESTSRIVSGEVKDAPTIKQLAKNPSAAFKQLEGNSYGTALLLQELANNAVQAKQYDKAVGYYERLLKSDGLAESVMQPMRYNLAQLYYQQGHFEKAIKAMRAYFKAGGSATAEAWVLLASAYVQSKQYELAIRPLESAIDTLEGATGNSQYEAWHRLLLKLHLQRKKYADAERVLLLLTEAYPQKLEYWQQLADVYLRQQDAQAALAAVEMAYRLGLLDAADQLGQLLQLFIRADVPFYAASLLQDWMQKNRLPSNAESYLQLAALWQQAQESQKAAQALDAALATQSKGQWWLQLGQIRLDARQWRQAEIALQTAIERGGLGKHVDEAWLALGLARYQLQQFDRAAQAFMQARRYSSSANAAQQWLDYLKDIQSYGFFGSAVAASAQADSANDIQATGLFQQGAIEAPVQTLSEPTTVGRVNSDVLTPVGAEQAANSAGDIPEWLGGLVKTQPELGAKNPYADEKPLYVVNSKNWNDYADFLSAGHQALFKAYPDYQMPVYPSHRSVGYAQAIYDATLANEETASLRGSDSLLNAKLGFPFRQPSHGAQVLWNHRVRYRGDSFKAQIVSVAQRSNGDFFKTVVDAAVLFDYGNIQNPGRASGKNLLLYYFAQTLEPSQARGATVLAHDTIDVDQSARKIWAAGGGYKKVLRIPPIGYDFPNPGSEGLQFVDMIDMYNGAFDRYDWRLIGKREMLVPYNSYQLNRSDVTLDQVLGKHFLNPAYTRYEKHRVWVVDAVKRSGTSHHFRKRRFYVDEDSWNILMVDGFNATNRLWKFQEGHLLPQPQIQAATSLPEVVYDLVEGRYFATKLRQGQPDWQYNLEDLKPGWFSPTKLGQRIR